MTRLGGIFGIPPGSAFSARLMSGLADRADGELRDVLAMTQIFTNSRRAGRNLSEALARLGPYILPRIHVISDLDALGLGVAAQEAPESVLGRTLHLNQLVRKLLATRPELAPQSASFDLAQALAGLADELAAQGVDAGELEGLVGGEFAQHWELTLQFVALMRELASAGGPPEGSEAWQTALIEALVARWDAAPPQHPVIVAGSTGSRPVMRRLMAAVLKLPQGAVILPGFDFQLDGRSWAALRDPARHAGDHPQAVFARLLEALDLAPGDVRAWDEAASGSSARSALVSLAMRPAPVTDAWLAAAGNVSGAAGEALDGLSVAVSRTPRQEAQAVAIALREAVETGRTAALITPDGTLTRRVTACLARWGITPDESAGAPLNRTPPAVFLSLVAIGGGAADVGDLLSLLKHPICHSGAGRGEHLGRLRRLDRDVLRYIGRATDWPRLRAAVGTEDEEMNAWLDWIETALAFLPDPAATGSMASHLDALLSAAGALADGATGAASDALWDKASGAKLHEVVERLHAASDAAGPLTFAEFRDILSRLIAVEQVREEGFLPDARVAIWGTLEARMQSADLVILAGLNEGTWPQQPPPDPWLNRSMRAALGLALPEYRVGLAAHDFQLAATHGRVILSRAERDPTAPTVPARWLVRLQNLLTGSGAAGEAAWDAACDRGARYVAMARVIDQADNREEPARRPCPAPPVSARPARLSVTDIEALLRDPYSVYARRVLGLRPMARLGAPPDVRLRGTVAHGVLEAFVRETATRPAEEWEDALADAAMRIMAADVPWPATRAVWSLKLIETGPLFLANEAARRAIATPRPDWLETRGVLEFEVAGRQMVLTGKADRIDLCADGRVAIYDYKYSVPKKSKQHGLFSKQLPIEAWMIRQGAFGEVGAREMAKMGIISIGDPSKDLDAVWEGKTEADFWTETLTVIAHFMQAGNGFGARLYPFREDDEGDYDQLARFGEWEDGAAREPEVWE